MGADQKPGQLPLALRFPPDQRFDTFVAADPATLAPLRQLLEGRGDGCVFVAGAAGSGKTHLAIATCAALQERGVETAYLPLASASGRLAEALKGLHASALVAVDGVERIAGDRDDEVALFDFHNRVRDAGGALAYTARDWPDALPLVLPDLRSRLAQGARVALAPLDDAGRAQLLRLRAQRRGLQLEPAAIDWLLRRVGRDVAGLAGLLDRLDRAALAAQRRITVPFLREVLGPRGESS